jgi:hypothetical protein
VTCQPSRPDPCSALASLPRRGADAKLGRARDADGRTGVVVVDRKLLLFPRKPGWSFMPSSIEEHEKRVEWMAMAWEDSRAWNALNLKVPGPSHLISHSITF